MTIDALKSRPANPATAHSKPTPIHANSAAHPPASAPVKAVVGKPAANAEKRRTQRVLLRVRAKIHVTMEGKANTFEVRTVTVHPHGALVVMNQTLPMGTRLVLEHSATGEVMGCKVAHPPREMPEGFHVPLTFDTSAPDFWKIDFPPDDWRPDDL